LLPGGDCESIEKMQSALWRLSQHPAAGVRAGGEVAPGNAHAGQCSVRLMAHAVDLRSPPALLESPPVWLTTPPVAVPIGSVVRIHGWIRVPAPITSSLDGVMVFDSLGGPGLAARFDAPVTTEAASAGNGVWREFTLYRAVRQEASANGRTADLVVTFVLTGLGNRREPDTRKRGRIATGHRQRDSSVACAWASVGKMSVNRDQPQAIEALSGL
jgi:hypothetical protein